jgi:hypothetical protein
MPKLDSQIARGRHCHDSRWCGARWSAGDAAPRSGSARQWQTSCHGRSYPPGSQSQDCCDFCRGEEGGDRWCQHCLSSGDASARCWEEGRRPRYQWSQDRESQRGSIAWDGSEESPPGRLSRGTWPEGSRRQRWRMKPHTSSKNRAGANPGQRGAQRSW